MQKPWAVVCDFDGTLTPKSWVSLFSVVDKSGCLPQEIADALVLMREKYLPKMKSAALTKEEERQWFDETISLYARAGLTLAKIEEVLAPVIIRDGVHEFLDLLRVYNVPVAVVSYGVRQFISAVLDKNAAVVNEIYSADLIVSESGLVTGYRPETAVFPNTKGDFSRQFADYHGIPHENILAIGDSGGDATLGCLKEHRLGIAKDEQEEKKLGQFMGRVVVTENFEPVCDWVWKKIRSQ